MRRTGASTAFSPVTRLFYFLALEECTGSPTGYPDQTGQRFLRALNIETGKIVWEVPQPDAAKAKTWSGVLATAGGLGCSTGSRTAASRRWMSGTGRRCGVSRRMCG